MIKNNKLVKRQQLFQKAALENNLCEGERCWFSRSLNKFSLVESDFDSPH